MTFNKPDQFFTPFEKAEIIYGIPDQLTFLSVTNVPHPLCLLAAEQLQKHLGSQEEWTHNFGLLQGTEGTVIGKMFGVLVAKTSEGEIGYLAAFSGKLAGGNHHSKFVPPVYDALTENSFLNNGMQELTNINLEIKKLEEVVTNKDTEAISKLKMKRKNHSTSLQSEIFEKYYFLNKAGEEKSLTDIFKTANYKNPPSGAGECAAPKLLQYAFQNKMKPLAIAEFWWGLSPKSDLWKHGVFYPCCREKCEPILAHMLS